MALGVVITYRVSRVINLAQGATGVLAAFLFHYTLMGRMGLPVALASLVAILFGAALGAGVERFAVRPVRHRGALATLTVTTGVLLMFSELTVQIWGPDNPPIASVFSDHVVRIGNTGVTVHQLATAAAWCCWPAGCTCCWPGPGSAPGSPRSRRTPARRASSVCRSTASSPRPGPSVAPARRWPGCCTST